MNHVKKLVLVPHEAIARLNDPTPSSSHSQMSALDTEMNYILRKQYADDSEKWKKYNEALQRFLHFSKESQKPFSMEISSILEEKQDAEADPEVGSVVRQRLASVLPRTYKDQAVKIHDYLVVNGSPVKWDANGVISLKGTVIPHSNIIDLISDLTRFRKNFEPTGVNQFIHTLAHLNIPLDLIGNEKRRTAILQAKQSGSGFVAPVPTPPRKTEIKKTRAKNNAWKTW